MGVEISDK